MERLKAAAKKLEAEKADPPPSEECFCYICGGTSTWAQLVKRSTFVADGDGEQEYDFDTLYEDYCSCSDRSLASAHEPYPKLCRRCRGYDQSVIRLKDVKWLGNIRMISHYEENTRSEDVDEELEGRELLTPIGRVDHGRNYGEDWKFRYSETQALVRSQGCAVHNACLEILKRVYRETMGPTRPLNLREVLLVLQVSAKSRDRHDFDWGLGKVFDVSSDGHNRMQSQYWNPVENSEWTVTNPQKAVNLRPLVSKASRTANSGYSFKFQGATAAGSNLSLGKQADCFSSIPTELRLRMLEMLPTTSVLNLFLASPAFRALSVDLPRRFWRSRLSFDVPWCAEAAIGLIAEEGIHPFPFDKILRLIRETSKPDRFNLDKNSGPKVSIENWMVLRNLRRVWINCERIINDIETRHTTIRRQSSSVPTEISNPSSHKTIFVSRDFKEPPEAASVAYFVPEIGKRDHLRAIIAHLGAGDQIIGPEFQLANELSGRLFGTSSNYTSKIILSSHTVIVAVCVSFGSPELNQNERRIRGLGFVTQESPSKPSYILGEWNDHDVVQVLRVQPGMEVVEVVGEFNAQMITTFGIITANHFSTSTSPSEPPVIDLDVHTQWAGRYPPLEWPLGQYFLERCRNGTSQRYPVLRNPFPRVLVPPVRFVDLSRRKLSQVQAYGDFDAIEPCKRLLKGLVFHFSDGSRERVSGETSHRDIVMSLTHNVEFAVQQNETITNMVLYCALEPTLQNDSAKLCGLQFITSIDRKLLLGCIETGERIREEPRFPAYNAATEHELVCGIQVVLEAGAVARVGLAFQKA